VWQAGWYRGARERAVVPVPAIDTTSRAAVKAAYNTYFNIAAPAVGWNGTISPCNPGTITRRGRAVLAGRSKGVWSEFMGFSVGAARDDANEGNSISISGCPETPPMGSGPSSHRASPSPQGGTSIAMRGRA